MFHLTAVYSAHIIELILWHRLLMIHYSKKIVVRCAV